MNDVRTPASPFQEGSTPLGADDLLLLVHQCKSKDKKAQKQFYDRFAPVLYAKIRRYVYEVNSASEILNDCFFKILTNLDSYSSTGPFEGWMHRITINTIMDHLRKSIKHSQLIHSGTEDHDISIPETTVGKLAYKELLGLIHSLPDVHRSVFNLFVFDDCSHKEIAQYLGISENNSRWHLNDARRRLKDKIEALK